MSALPPESRHRNSIAQCPLCAKSGHSAVWLKTSLFDHLAGAVETVARAEPLRAWLLGWSNPAYDETYERPGIVIFDMRVDARWHLPWCITAPCVARTSSQ